MRNFNLRNALFFIALITLLFMKGAGQSPTSNQNEDEKNASIKTRMDAAVAADRKGEFQAAIDAYNSVIELDPDNYLAHKGLIQSSKSLVIRPFLTGRDLNDPKVLRELDEKLKPVTEANRAKYELLAENNPTKAVYQLILSLVYPYDPLKVDEVLQNAIRLEPNNIAVLTELAKYESFKGNYPKVNEYFKRISDLDPQNIDAAFNYYNSFADFDEKLFKQKATEFLKLYPTSERSAQLLYEIASSTEKETDRVILLEKLKENYPPAKYRATGSAMYDLLAIYIASNRSKAMALAQEMATTGPENGKKEWQGFADYLTTLNQAENLLKENKASEALSILEKYKPSIRYQITPTANEKVFLLRARAQSANGQKDIAYQNLLDTFIKTPTDGIRRELTSLGKVLGKKETQVELDIQTSVNKLATPIKDFSLPRYDQNKNVSLADYRGKVIILNFWYPLCGPCHAEAPFLQKILSKYGRDKLVILSPSVHPKEDSMVLPYFARNRFEFIPLKVPSEFWSIDNYNASAMPTNFLIDKKGNKVFNLGAVSFSRLRETEMKVEMLLSQKP